MATVGGMDFRTIHCYRVDYLGGHALTVDLWRYTKPTTRIRHMHAVMAPQWILYRVLGGR